MATQTLSPAADDSSFFGHPRGLATLFFTEMWERFSYYGMRALLILFMTAPVAKGGLGFGVVKAGAIYGPYTAMVYLLCLPGGWIADNLTGHRRAVLYGGILIICGQFSLMVPSVAVFYVGLALLAMGTGMLKANASTIVGQLYAPGDRRRDSGFSIFYMGINLGALISPVICGWVGEKINWRLGFGLAGLGMLAGLIQYSLSGKYLGTAGLHPVKPASPEEGRRLKRQALLASAIGFGTIVVLALLANAGTITLTAELLSNALGVALVILSLALFAWLIFGPGWSAQERKRAVAILVLFLASVLFFSTFEQAGSSLNLFAERNTNRTLFGFNFPASWFQFVEPAFLIAFAPVFAWLWIALGKREPSSPTKFTLGLLFGGLAFLLLVPAAAMAMKGTLVSPWWLTGTYFLQTLGELSLSPVGLSAMTKLAPERAAGLMMGVWFVSLGVGNYLAGRMASLYESLSLPSLFGIVATFALVAAVILAFLVKPTVRLMSGVK
ncbi:MAG TPA: peptide MFS transporter [Bryobacteraceae bacterium]|nr:peptide MFS transporter [Bryobacteraceae bacterium]